MNTNPMPNIILPPQAATLSPRRTPFGMLPARHIRRLAMLSRLNVLTAALVVAAALPAAVRGADLSEPLARQAFAVASNWVERGRAPDRTLALPVADLAAVHVTLRLDGLTLGSATATAADPLDPAPGTDLFELLRRAVADALVDAQQSLTNSQHRAASPSDEPGARLPDSIAQVARRLQLDLQLARTPRPIKLNDFVELPEKFVIDHHGLLLRHGNRTGWMFPATAMAANVSLAGQIDRLMAQIELPLIHRPLIGSDAGPALYRFQTIHLVPGDDRQPAMVLHRGNRLLSAQPLDGDAVADYARRWTDHLLGRQREDGRFAGAHLPSAGRYQPPVAPHPEAAMACYALARRARVPGLPEARAERLAGAARRGLVAITDDLLGTQLAPAAEPAPRDDRREPAMRLAADDCAMTLIALIAAPGASDLKPQRDRLAGALLAMQKPDGSFRRTDLPGDRPAARPVQALAACALARMYDATREPTYLNHAQVGLVAAWHQIARSDAHIASALPWLAEAEFTLARLEHPTPGLLELHKTANRLRNRQVRPDRLDDPDRIDTTGGFRLGEGLIPEPTAHSARPLVFLAHSLRVAHFIPHNDQPAWLLDVNRGLRFCAQLTMTDASCFYTPAPANARGGVRNAIWDNRQPLPATALSLLAATELEHSLSALSRRATPAGTPTHSPHRPQPAGHARRDPDPFAPSPSASGPRPPGPRPIRRQVRRQRSASPPQ